MQNVISIAGATGNPGGLVASALRKRGAAVRALVRPGTAPERLSKLRQQGVEVVEVDLNQSDALAHACEGSWRSAREHKPGAVARGHFREIESVEENPDAELAPSCAAAKTAIIISGTQFEPAAGRLCSS